MSFDLAVFDTTVAPTTREAFLEWFGQQTEWSEDHDYGSPSGSTPAIRAWFADIIQEFPPMNGPGAGDGDEGDGDESEDEDDASVTDYSIAKGLVYAAFAWSRAERAAERTIELAAKHGLGFFNVSSDKSEVLLPDGKGGLALAHSD